MKSVIVIVAWNGAQYLPDCLDAVLAQHPAPWRVIVVDNASEDQTVSLANDRAPLAAAAGCRFEIVRNSANLGFTKAANIGLRLALAEPDCDMAVLLNQDTLAQPGWLHALETVMAEQEDAGALGCRIYYPDGKMLQHAGGCLEQPRMVGVHRGQHEPDQPLYDALQDADYVTGAAMGLRASSLRQVGLLDEIFSPGYYEDVDLCQRLRAQRWRVLYCPEAKLLHIESASFAKWGDNRVLSQRNRILFAMRVLGETDFAQQFVEAECAHIQHDSDFSEVRALALAYGQVLLLGSARSEAGARLVEPLIGLRRACLQRVDSLYDAHNLTLEPQR